MADLQKELAETKRQLDILSRDYAFLSGKYGELLELMHEEPCQHPDGANCWHRNRILILSGHVSRASGVKQ